MENTEKERLLFCIGRYDHYYDSINNKCNVFLTLSLAIVGGLLAAYPTLLDKVACTAWLHINMAILLVVGTTNILFTMWTSMPFLKTGGTSLLYFGSVAKMTPQAFYTRSSAEDAQAGLDDLRTQVHVLAQGLRKKFRRLFVAGTLLMIQFMFFIPLIYTIVKNLK